MKYNNIEKEADIIYSIIISKKENDLNQMDYKDMIKNDKRTYLRIYWSFFVYSKINIGTFCTENNLHLFVIKLSEISVIDAEEHFSASAPITDAIFWKAKICKNFVDFCFPKIVNYFSFVDFFFSK